MSKDDKPAPSDENLQKQIRRLRAVYHMSEVIARAGELQAFYDAAIEALVDALGVDRASILIFDPDGAMRFKASRGLSDPYRAAVEGHSPWKQDELNPQPIVVPDVNVDEGLKAFREMITSEGITALAFVPLKGPSGLLGTIVLYCDQVHDFQEDEIKLAQTIARHVGFAIERTRAAQEREHLLERERAARFYVERVNRLKDEFLATLSHELRTPLQAMLGWSRLLLTERLDPDQVSRAAEIIERNATIQARLIDDLLDMSRIISGKVSLNVKKVDLTEMVDAALATVMPAAEAKQIDLKTRLDRSLPEVLADVERLQQVAWNLLSNAIKFTPRNGSIEVSLRRAGDYAELSIKDSGEGIPAEFLPYVFERFLQADASTTRRQGGLGLGLAIVRNLVELHGGIVRAESDGQGQGATFRVFLPIPVRTIETIVEPAEAAEDGNGGRKRNLKGTRILIVDDEADARELMKFVLEESGAEVLAAGSVDTAVENVVSWKPHLLVTDIAMPEQDGFELIRRVRSLPPEHGGKIPAAALTALVRSDDRLRVLDSGFQVHLAKPIEPALLVETVAKLMARDGSK